jgi:hypothetical protein
MPEAIVARILRLPGYGVYAWEAEDAASILRLWVRQTGEPVYVCGGCGRAARVIHSGTERRVRDLPWGTWTVWLVVEVHRVRCRCCGVRTERIPWLAGNTRDTARLAAAVAQDGEHAPVSRVAGKWGLPPETVRRLDKRVLRRWAAGRPRAPLRYLGVDEIFLGKGVKFLTVVSNLETGEPVWLGRERKRETLDRFFAEALPRRRRRFVRAVGVDMWEPFVQSETEEQATLLPLAPEPFDRPTWARGTVHPDHHIQFRRALYSVPTRYIGEIVDVRGDSRLVRIHHRGELIKVHPPQPPGGRSTDYTDYPAEQTPYAMRTPDACVRRAAEVGPAVGQFVTVLLGGTFPWARLRQAQKLLRLAERYGATRVNAACARALAFDLVEVRRVEAIVRIALEHEPPATERGTVVPLPARFTRPDSRRT